MNLTEKEKQKIIEQEEYRQKIREQEAFRVDVRSKLNQNTPTPIQQLPKKKGIGCLGTILIFLLAPIGITALLSAIIPSFSKNKTSPLSSISPEQQADNYCQNRKTTTRIYPILDLVEGSDGNAKLKPFASRRGKDLTRVDCIMAVTALIFANDIDNIEKINNGQIWAGMNKFEFGYSIGTPDKIITISGGEEALVFQGLQGEITTFYFDGDSILTNCSIKNPAANTALWFCSISP